MYLNTLYQGGEIIVFDASLPHLRHFSLVVGRLSGVSTKNAAYIVKTLTVDAALETMDLHCDFKGWDTPTIYRTIERHSKTLRVLSAPGWYAHTAMLQALDGFTVLEEVTLGRIEHLEVRQLPLQTSCHSYTPGLRPERLQKDPKGLPLQPPTRPTSPHKRNQGATPSRRIHHSHLWRKRVYERDRSIHQRMEGERMLSLLSNSAFSYGLFRSTGHMTQCLKDHGGTSYRIGTRQLRA